MELFHAVLPGTLVQGSCLLYNKILPILIELTTIKFFSRTTCPINPIRHCQITAINSDRRRWCYGTVLIGRFLAFLGQSGRTLYG